MQAIQAIHRDLIRPIHGLLHDRFNIPDGPQVDAISIAIGLQESRFVHRDQVDSGPAVLGPATGFWQFELGGGTRGVLEHPATSNVAIQMTQQSGLQPLPRTVWASFADPRGDELACVFARLLLYSDPRPLPPATAAAEQEAWSYYIRNWRPGKPKPNTWPGFWAQALEIVRTSSAAAPVAPAPSETESLKSEIERLKRKIAEAQKALA